MSETPEATAEVRAFWPTDYRRFASTIKTVRREQGDAAADALLATVSQHFSADSADFDPAKFAAGTGTIPAHFGALASHVRQMKHKRCQPMTPADPAKVTKVEALEADLAGIMVTDSRFDAEKFTATAALQQAGSVYSDDSDEGEGDDELYSED